MLPRMAKMMSIGIVGPGRLGTALALALKGAGYSVTAIVTRRNALSQQKARSLAKRVGARMTASTLPSVVWFCVPDRQIGNAAKDFSEADWKGRIAFHASGALSSDELHVLRKKGAAVAAVHPLMTFVTGAVPSLRGVSFAIEGDARAVRTAREIVRKLGGEAFMIRKRDKPAYHAWGGFTSPLLVAMLVAGEQVAMSAGLSAVEARKRMLPILCQTIANYAELGPEKAFSGPIVRGDAETVSKHLRALARVPEAREVYLALARVALRHLPAEHKKELKKLLKGKG